MAAPTEHFHHLRSTRIVLLVTLVTTMVVDRHQQYHREEMVPVVVIATTIGKGKSTEAVLEELDMHLRIRMMQEVHHRNTKVTETTNEVVPIILMGHTHNKITQGLLHLEGSTPVTTTHRVKAQVHSPTIGVLRHLDIKISVMHMGFIHHHFKGINILMEVIIHLRRK